MTTQQQKQSAIFPDLPRDDQISDEHGMLTASWKLYFQQLTMALQTNLKPEGYVVPPKPTSDIIQLIQTASNNNIIYDSTTNEFKGNVNGTWKVFTLT
jgi:hypothetical protein